MKETKARNPSIKKDKKNKKNALSSPTPKKRKRNTITPSTTSSYEDKCTFIAQLSETILEDPESALKPKKSNNEDEYKQPSLVRQLITIGDISSEEERNSDDYGIARLAIISILAIFQDILPTYRIRLPTSSELSVRVAKETKKLWDYERDLLTHYQSYLKLLERTWEHYKPTSSTNTTPEEQLGITAMLSLTELLKSAHYFNFRSNILTSVIRQMNCSTQVVSKACCTSIQYIFQHDAQGDITCEAVKLISTTIHNRKFNVKPETLQTFLSLPLRVHHDELMAAKILSKKQKKKDAEQSEIEKDMKEGETGVDKLLLAQMQADTLHAVTITYFRILKAIPVHAQKHPKEAVNAMKLLPSALEGLAKFAHLIHFDTVVDLLNLLRALLVQSAAAAKENGALCLSVEATFNCVLTAFQALSGPGKELNIDMKEYAMPLYNHLDRICTQSNSIHTPLALQCLTSTFLQRREFSSLRIASFVKRLLTTCLHAPPHTAAPILTFLRQMFIKYSSQLEQLLENELDKVASCGLYNPKVDDPEHANPLATSAWELSLLKFSIRDSIRDQAVAISMVDAASKEQLVHTLTNSAHGTQEPQELFDEMIKDEEEGYIACKVNMKKHPLAVDRKRNKRNRVQCRFLKSKRKRLKVEDLLVSCPQFMK